MYNVYKIEVNEVCLYIGHTKDLKKREYAHNYLLKKGKKKELYDYLRSVNIDNITLIEIASFTSKTSAKRLEVYLILKHKFIKDNVLEVPRIDCVELKQSIPQIRDI
jgi:predicted GIY-YIG superfamily endonuclease